MFFLCANLVFAQTYLPFHKQGKWGVLDDSGSVVLSPKYAKIGFFVGDYTPVKLSLKWGVISKDDKIIVPIEFDKVELVSPIFECYFKVFRDSGWGLIDREQNQLIENKYEQLIFLDPHYYGLRNELHYLGKIGEGEIYKTGFTYLQKHTDGHFIGTENSNSYHLLDSTGRLVLESRIKSFRFYFNSILVNTNDSTISVFKKNGTPVLAGITEVEIQSDMLSYKIDGDTSVLFNLTTHQEFFRGTFDRILSIPDGFLIQKNNKWAVVDSAGTNVSEWEFDEVVYTEGGYLRVKKNGVFGVWINVAGTWRESIPCRYEFIYRSGPALLYSLNDKIGVLSLSGKRISGLKFDNIEVNDNGYKGYGDEGLTLITLDASGELITLKTFTNVISVKGNMSNLSSRESLPVTSSLSNGWFLDSIRSKSDTSIYIKKYGLRDFNDTIKVQPTYPYVQVGDKYSFAFRKRKPKNLPNKIKKVETIPYYTSKDVYLNATREKINSRLVYGFANNDLIISNSGLIFDDKGIRIIDTSGNVLYDKVKYMDVPSLEMNRFCVSEKMIEYKSRDEGVQGNARAYWTRLDGFPTFIDGTYSPSLPVLSFPESKWGYMFSAGELAFEPQFDEAAVFAEGHASVMNNGRYGVVNKDTICIPIQYLSVQTIPAMQDTLVVTTSASSGLYQIVDSIAEPSTNVSYRVLEVEKKHNVVLVKEDDKYGYINYDLSFKVVPSFKRKPRFYDDYLIVKGKKFGVYDHLGNELEADQYKEIDRYENECVVFVQSKRQGVAKNGKVILPAKFKSIQFRKEYIRAEERFRVELYTYNGELYSNKKWIYADYCDQLNILVYGKKGKVYLENEDKTFKRTFVSDAKYGFEDTLLVVTNKGQCSLETIRGKKITNSLYTDIRHFRDSLYWIYNGKSVGMITNTGTLLFEARYKKLIEIYPGIWGGASIGIITVKNENNQELLTRKGTSITNSGNDMFLVVNGNQYVFMNSKFQNAFNEVFTGARSYIGKYAAVSVD
ncbi:MAG: hypothetical protein ACI8Q1_002062, partial [Parvicella sp.]